MKELLGSNKSDNTIVHIIMRGSDNKEYECVGVLVREAGDMLRVGFNAKNDKVVDYLDIKISDVISIDTLDPLSIDKLW